MITYSIVIRINKRAGMDDEDDFYAVEEPANDQDFYKRGAFARVL